MNEILNIINSTLNKQIKKTNFDGELYFWENNHLNIDRTNLNRLLNKFNSALKIEVGEGSSIDLNEKILLAFVNEIFEDNSGNLFRMDRNYFFSTIFMEDGFTTLWSEETIGSNKKPDQIIGYYWNEIESVELFENQDNDYYFRFHIKNEPDHIDLFANRFGTKDLQSCHIIRDLLNNIIDYKNELIEKSKNRYNEITFKIDENLKNSNYEEVLVDLEHFAKMYDIKDPSKNQSSYFFLNKSMALLYLGEYEKALTTIDNFIKICDIENYDSPNAHKIKGKILLRYNNYLSAINCFAYGEENFITEENINDLKQLKEDTYEKIKVEFINIKYDKRKLVFFSENIHSTQSGELIVLKLNDIPELINFPFGHPLLNEVYICHPIKNDFYIPFKNYQQELFIDRVNEYSYLLQCLGAKRVEIVTRKIDFDDLKENEKSSIDVEASNKVAKLEINHENQQKQENISDNHIGIEKLQLFKPSEAPYIPDDLVWYQTELSWQRLVNQRLKGNIISHRETITSIQNETISNHEMNKLNAELKLLLPKINLNYKNEKEVNTNSKKSLESFISVEFENKLTLTSNNVKIDQNLIKDSIDANLNNNELQNNINKYKEEVIFMLENDGLIDALERKFLDRKLIKYGISKELATKIENEILISRFTKNERKYIDEIKEILEDGKITQNEKELLNRYAKKYEISEGKQILIDSLFIPNS